MSSPGSSGRRRTTSRQCSAEDQALNQIAREAEARLSARRAARAEARDIRMRELEKQQRESDDSSSEAEEKKDRHYEMLTEHRATPNRSFVTNSRRNSEDSSSADDSRELKKELLNVEEKYKRAMMTSAQLDNDKQTYRYQVELLKDEMEETTEQLVEVQREHRDRCKELENKKRDFRDLQNECGFLRQQLELRDQLIEENGLVYVSNGTLEDGDGKTAADDATTTKKQAAVPVKEAALAALVTPEIAEMLQLADGSLDERLKAFAEEKKVLQMQVRTLRQQLDEETEKTMLSEKFASPPRPNQTNGPEIQLLEVQMEAQKQLNDYKYRLKKAEQDITTLEGNVLRLESQVKRYRTAAEGSEKMEDDLKTEKRKLQRELRESQSQMEELQTQNVHLQKRLDKIKSARNAALVK